MVTLLWEGTALKEENKQTDIFRVIIKDKGS